MSLNTIVRKTPSWTMYIVLLIPGGALFGSVLQDPGPNPVENLEHGLGEFALRILVLGLLITPLRDTFNLDLIKFRRSIGLMAFFYVFAHLVVYLLLDKQLMWDPIIKDVTQRPYIMLGVVSFLILLSLAITSNSWSIRKLGPVAWRKLHWWVYAACFLGVAHFSLLKKTWQAEPLIYFGIFVVLIGYRGVKHLRVSFSSPTSKY